MLDLFNLQSEQKLSIDPLPCLLKTLLKARGITTRPKLQEHHGPRHDSLVH